MNEPLSLAPVADTQPIFIHDDERGHEIIRAAGAIVRRLERDSDAA